MLTTDDRFAIERLYAAYAHYIDSDRFEEWVALFAVDAVLVTSDIYSGRAELAAFVRKRAELQKTASFSASQHWFSNLLVEEDGDVVRGSCYLARFVIDRGSGPLIRLFSECHELFGDPNHGREAADLAVQTMRRARKTAITLGFDTQSSRADAIPPKIVELVKLNACFG